MRPFTCITRVAVVASLVATGCSNDSGGERAAGSTTTTTTTESLTTTPPTPQRCTQGATGSLGEVATIEAGADASSPAVLELTSFDGTSIRTNWFPTASNQGPAPTVLMGPGWSLPGETNLDGSIVFGALSIRSLNEAGYNVVTWDPRGFGQSGGEVTINSAQREGRDVQVLLDWVSEQPGALVDGDGDPRVGMIGASYGGGIQLVTAGIDCRVDALVPNMAWNSLDTSLYRSELLKAGWAGELTSIAGAARLDPHITSATESGQRTGSLSDQDRSWFLDRGPAEAVSNISTPTLLVHGTVDTLFTLDEAIENYRLLSDAGTEVAMRWYCGGHGVCLSDPNPDLDWVSADTIAWLDRWLKDDESVNLGPAFVVADQDGTLYDGAQFPPEAGAPIVARADGGTLELATTPYDPIVIPPGDILGSIVEDITPTNAHVALTTAITATSDAFVLGAPTVSFSYSGTAGAGDAPTRLFVQFVDPTNGVVVGAQVTPIAVELDGETHRVEVPLEAIAHRLDRGTSLIAQIVATSPSYATPRLGGTVTITDLEYSLRTATGLIQR